MSENRDRIWIETDGECPYFYFEDELHEAEGRPLAEFVAPDYEWVPFKKRKPSKGAIVQQYLGELALENENPPDWAFPTKRWFGKKDTESGATHWRYVLAPVDA